MILFLLTGIAIWGLAFHESIKQKEIYSFNESVYYVYLTIAALIIPITLTSNLFSFLLLFLKSTIFFTNYSIKKITKSFLFLFIITNMLYLFIFLTPLFIINNETNELLTLIFMSTGIGIPITIIISSLKISSIDLTKSKTYNYSGLSVSIIFLTIIVLVFCFLLFYFSELIFGNKIIIPLVLGITGFLILPLWVNIIRIRLHKIKFRL
jgi:hypothetical protein